MSEQRQIIACEPQFGGVTHSRFNAGLLESLASAWPGDSIHLRAPEEHCSWVERTLREAAASARPTYDYVPHPPGLQRAGRRRRFAVELHLYASALRTARARQARLLLFCSVSKTGLVALKVLAPVLGAKVPVVATLHQLGKLESESSRGPLRRLWSLASILALPSPSTVRIAIPSLAVLDELRSIRPQLARRLGAFEPPLLGSSSAQTAPKPPGPGAICFGFFGSGSPGRIEPFFDLARELSPHYPNARFLLIGRLREGVEVPQGLRIEGLGYEPLSQEELARRARQVHWAVWNGDPASYRLTLSASFLDAVALGLPCLCRRTPITDRYFERLGGIGHLFDDPASLKLLVERLLTDDGSSAYEAAAQAAHTACEYFAPAAAGKHLRQLLKTAGGRS